MVDPYNGMQHTHYGSSLSFGTHMDDCAIHELLGAVLIRKTYFHKHFASLLLHDITGYLCDAFDTRCFIRCIVTSHVSLGSRTHPTIFLDIFLWNTSIFCNETEDNGKSANPYKIVGVTTASKNFKRKRIAMLRLQSICLCWPNLYQPTWMR